MSLSSTRPKSSDVEKRLLTYSAIAIAVVIGLRLLLGLFQLPTSFHGVLMEVPYEVTFTSLLMMLIFWFDSNVYIRKHHLGVGHYTYAITSVIVVVVVVGSVVLHEFGHALVANMLGHTIDHAGLTFWGAFVAPEESMLVMSPFDEVAISLAGPAVNILIAVIGVMVVKVFGESLFENSAQYVAVMNIRLARLNLIPLLILDGGKVVDGLLRFIVTDQSTRTYLEIGIFVAFWVLYKKYRKTHKPYEDSLSQM